ncbi:MAG: hypothetical protein JXQ66_02265 [Campylobacterales bacterium]|nr:hypothetical protein [Campylobacterales bacterium]
MLKDESIFVKLCDMTKKLLDENNQPLDRRFNSIDEQEMIDFNQEHFKNKENKNFFYITAKLFVEKYFLEKNINNLEYEKKVFSLIQLTIMEQLMDRFDHCEEFFKGFAGYIFRRNFISVFEYIAELLLYEVSILNTSVIDFLKYYSLNIVVMNGQRYITPNIETNGGLRWNVSSMLSIVKLYFKAQGTIKHTQKHINDIEFKLMQLHINGLTPIEFNKKIINKKIY